jgi:fucose permease
MEATGFVMQKVRVALFEVRRTPTYISATDKTAEYSPLIIGIMMVWMIFARAAFFALPVCAARAWIRHREWSGILALGIVGAACAPYLVVFVWERHMVPILLMAGTFVAILYLSTPGRDSRFSR